MPSKTEKQRKMMAVAYKNPSKLYKRNKSVLTMDREKLKHYMKKK